MSPPDICGKEIILSLSGVENIIWPNGKLHNISHSFLDIFEGIIGYHIRVDSFQIAGEIYNHLWVCMSNGIMEHM